MNSHSDIKSMSDLADDGLLGEVKALIDAGDQSRPITYLFLTYESQFRAIRYLEFEDSKNKIRHKFLKQFPELENKCEIAKLFFDYPTADLEKEILSNHAQIISFMPPYIAWMAMHNDVAALRNPQFLQLFNQDNPFNESYNGNSCISVAAAFHSRDFIKVGFELKLFDFSDLKVAFCVAVVQKDNELLEFLAELANTHSFEMSRLNDPDLDPYQYDDPLFWSIRSCNPQGLRFLLAHGLKLEGQVDDPNYRGLAERMKHSEIISIVRPEDTHLIEKSNYTPHVFQPVEKGFTSIKSLDHLNFFCGTIVCYKESNLYGKSGAIDGKMFAYIHSDDGEYARKFSRLYGPKDVISWDALNNYGIKGMNLSLRPVTSEEMDQIRAALKTGGYNFAMSDLHLERLLECKAMPSMTWLYQE